MPVFMEMSSLNQSMNGITEVDPEQQGEMPTLEEQAEESGPHAGTRSSCCSAVRIQI